ncbi:MAG: hypothetical protein U0R19_21550 [Bryobacteraceae bacterium]
MASARRLQALGIALAAGLALAPSFTTGFLADDLYVVPKRLAMPAVSFWTEDYWAGYTLSGLYRPLGLSWLWLQKLAFGDSPAGYHLVSLGLHAGASWLLFLVLEPLWGAGALAAALLFAVHPVHAEAVIPVYGQLDLLAALLVLAAVLACRAGRHPLGLLALGAAMLVKESAFAGVGLLWLIARPPWLVLARYALLAVTAAGVRFAVLGSLLLPPDATVIGQHASLTLWAKSVIISLAHSIRLCIWPTGQTVYYGHLRDSLMGMPVAESTWLATAALFAASLWIVLPRRDLLLALGWFGITVFPVSNLAPIGVLVAERSLYLTAAAVTMLAAKARPPLLVLAGLVAIGASWHVTYQWRTEQALWEYTAAAHPRSPKAHAMVGWSMVRQAESENGGHRDRTLLQAEAAFDRALALNPRSTDGLIGRAVVRWFTKGCDAARADLEQALTVAPSDERLSPMLADCR